MRRTPILAFGALGLALGPALALRGQTRSAQPHGEIKLECSQCHNAERWTPVVNPAFRHETTGFALESAHAKASCRSCHRTLVFARVGVACADCHRDSHRGELGLRCESCHSPTSWNTQREVFRAHDRSRFPLMSVHARLDCAACHRSQAPYEYANTPADCGSCHYPTYLATTSPNHAASGFSRRCEDCHRLTAASWREAAFSHPDSFPLQGGHAGLACARCHGSGNPRAVSSACVSCHQGQFQSAANPNHVGGGFPMACESCHTILSWRPAKFDHDQTGFQLTGAHGQTQCAKCHVGGRYAGTPSDCYSCHQANYAGTTNPNHQASGFPTQCQNCHNTGAWRPANFDHNQTRFPLTGAHSRTDCAKCHTGGRYAGTPSDCYSCHQANYASAANPNHVASSFPTQCQTCHSTSAWRPASVDHSKTRFPLTGAHARVDCARCHTGGRYTGTPTDCYSCHQANYAGTTNPSHGSAGFPTTCQDCHNTSAWTPASFDHDGRYFPIYSGTHRGRWSSCADCHVSAGNYRAFECIRCHEHANRTEVDSKHKGVSGYVYASASCYQCHRNGRAGAFGHPRRLP